jgi:hypothetical protein
LLLPFFIITKPSLPTQISPSDIHLLTALRDYSDNYGSIAIVFRFCLYVVYFFLFPVLTVFRIVYDFFFFETLFMGHVFNILFSFYILRNLKKYYSTTNLVPFLVIILIISMFYPFIHTRYLIPFFFLICEYPTFLNRINYFIDISLHTLSCIFLNFKNKFL